MRKQWHQNSSCNTQKWLVRIICSQFFLSGDWPADNCTFPICAEIQYEPHRSNGTCMPRCQISKSCCCINAQQSIVQRFYDWFWLYLQRCPNSHASQNISHAQAWLPMKFQIWPARTCRESTQLCGHKFAVPWWKFGHKSFHHKSCEQGVAPPQNDKISNHAVHEGVCESQPVSKAMIFATLERVFGTLTCKRLQFVRVILAARLSATWSYCTCLALHGDETLNTPPWFLLVLTAQPLVL